MTNTSSISIPAKDLVRSCCSLFLQFSNKSVSGYGGCLGIEGSICSPMKLSVAFFANLHVRHVQFSLFFLSSFQNQLQSVNAEEEFQKKCILVTQLWTIVSLIRQSRFGKSASWRSNFGSVFWLRTVSIRRIAFLAVSHVWNHVRRMNHFCCYER